MDAAAKFDALLTNLAPLGRAVVAFSGGLDSSLLVFAARRALGEGALAVTIDAPYMPRAEQEDAAALARHLGVRHRRLKVPFPEAVRDNPPERCYICKRTLFALLGEIAAAEAGGHVLDGTNQDDLSDHRPGFRALRELGVKSPLLEAHLTKADIRELSRLHGLPTWDKPASACLLSRIPHGVRVEEAELERIDQGEHFLKQLGFAAVRLRSHGDVARIEVPRDMVAEIVAADRAHGIDARLKALGYCHVAVDLAGYRMGSLNDKQP